MRGKVLRFALGATVVGLTFGTAPTALGQEEREIVPATPAEAAAAMDIPAGSLVSASFAGDGGIESDPRGIGVADTPLIGFPVTGPNYLLLSTGYAADAEGANDTGGHSNVLSGLDNSYVDSFGSTNNEDMVEMRILLDPPDGVTCMAFDLAFASEEFPEFVDSQYNDVFTAQVNDTSQTISLDTEGKPVVNAPGNFAFDLNRNQLSINVAANVLPVAGGVAPQYDGRTGILVATTEFTPNAAGQIGLTLRIQDFGDSIYDSAAFIDRFQWITGECIAGLSFKLYEHDCAVPPPTTPFTDIAGSFAASDIACALASDIVSGTSGTTYSPNAVVTREQMAIFLIKALEAVTELPYAGPTLNPFGDHANSFANTRIQQLVGLGITAGTSATTYSPTDPVTREQMAIFLIRLYEKLTGQSPAIPATTTFTDIGNSYAIDEIKQLVGLGVTAGYSPTTYAPTAPVTRAEMAVFMIRILDAVV